MPAELVITGNIRTVDETRPTARSVAVADGRIVAIGKAGNPDTMDGVHPDLVIGPSTEVLAGR